MLRFYWSLGRNIVEISVKNGYGSGFYKTISSDLKDIFPDVHSFSPTNLKYMRYYYEMYPEAGNRQHLVDDYEMSENRPQVGDDCATDQNNPQVSYYAAQSSAPAYYQCIHKHTPPQT